MSITILGVELRWETLQSAVVGVVRGMTPAPKFHSASPEMHHKDEQDWQWWHVPISVKRKWLRRDIPCCKAYAVFVAGNLQGEEYPLRWRSDSPSGSSEADLIFGSKRMLPLVARRDRSPAATLTDNDFLMWSAGNFSLGGISGDNIMLAVTGSPQTDHAKSLTPGEHVLKIKVVSGHLEWESSDYKISVPQSNATNSHFTVVMDE